LVKPGELKSGTLRWTCNGQPSGNINYTCDMRDPEGGRLELRFTVTDKGSDEQRG